MREYLKYLLGILFFQLLFSSSVLDKPDKYTFIHSEMLNLNNDSAPKIKINLPKQEYLLKIKYRFLNSQIEGLYLNGEKLYPALTRKRGIIETNYFRVIKLDIKEGMNLFEIKLKNGFLDGVEFRIQNYQKIFFNAIYVFFDDTLIRQEKFIFSKGLKNFIFFALFFSFTIYLFIKSNRIHKLRNTIFSYLICMAPAISFFSLFRILSLVMKINIFVSSFFFWGLFILNFWSFIFLVSIKNISDFRLFKNKTYIQVNLFRLIAIVFSFCLFFLLGEVFFRVYYVYSKKESIFEISEPSISYLLKSNFRGRFSGQYISINSYGFRSHEHNIKKNPDVFRILCLGDSIVFGYGVSDMSPFPFQLETMLNKESKKYEVINMAVTGYNTVQERLLLEKIGLKFQPNLIIIGFCSNDITGGLRVPTMFGTLLDIANDPYRLEDMSLLTRLEYYLARKSFLYQLILLKFQALAKKYNWFQKEIVGSYPKSAIDYFGGVANSDIRHREEVFKSEILRIKNLADRNKIKLLLVSFPTSIHLERLTLRRVQEVLSNFCKDNRIYYLDLIPILSNFKREELFIDQDHLSYFGHKIVASQIGNIIENLRNN